MAIMRKRRNARQWNYMLFVPCIKEKLTEVREAIPRYRAGVYDVNEAMQNRAGSCAAITYLSLLVLNRELGEVPGFHAEFGYSPHVETGDTQHARPGHALGRLSIADAWVIINQTGNGDLRFGPRAHFRVSRNTMYYPFQEGYDRYVSTISSLQGKPVPEIAPEQVLTAFDERRGGYTPCEPEII